MTERKLSNDDLNEVEDNIKRVQEELKQLEEKKQQLQRRREETMDNFRKSVDEILEKADEMRELVIPFCKENKNSDNYDKLLTREEKKLLSLLMAAFAIDMYT